MHFPKCSNKIIQNRYEIFKNNVLFYNLQHIKSTINTNCPYSFYNRYYDLRQKKLKKLSNSANLEKKNEKLSFEQKERFIKIAQENQGMFRRIIAKKPEINFNQMEKEFLQNQYYKQQHCNYPSVNFFKPKTIFYKKSFNNSPNQRLNYNINRNNSYNILYKKNKSSINMKKLPNISTKSKKCTNNSTIKIDDSEDNSLNNLSVHANFPNYYVKKINFFNLGECSVEIILQKLK
jgi:hypothetical protein